MLLRKPNYIIQLLQEKKKPASERSALPKRELQWLSLEDGSERVALLGGERDEQLVRRDLPGVVAMDLEKVLEMK